MGRSVLTSGGWPVVLSSDAVLGAKNDIFFSYKFRLVQIRTAFI